MACLPKHRRGIKAGGQAVPSKTGPCSLDTATNKFPFERLYELLCVLDPKAAARLRACGTPMPLKCKDCGVRTMIRFRCTLRVCPECSRVRAEKLRAVWQRVFRTLGALRVIDYRKLSLLTLTIRTDGDVRSRLGRMIRCVNLFWKQTWGAERGSGALIAYEVGENYNVHAHILLHGRYISHSRLVRIWREITGDSFVLDIRRVRGLDGAILEVLKYVTKGIVGGTDPYKIALIHMAFRGRRRVVTKGVFYNIGVRVTDSLACASCGGSLGLDYPMTSEHERGPLPFRSFRVTIRNLERMLLDTS